MSSSPMLSARRGTDPPIKRPYTKVTDEKRLELIDLLNRNMSIKEASDQMGINYENAKAIYRVYRLEQRKTKQQKRLSRFSGAELARDSMHMFMGSASGPILDSSMHLKRGSGQIQYLNYPSANENMLLSFDRQAEMHDTLTREL